MAEDFGAQPSSPQIACLQGLRGSDIVVLILGEHYGFVPPGSSLSATPQEYREARETKPVLAFVQQGISPGPEQAAFIAEVQAWEGGLFRGGFVGVDDLQDGMTCALHDVTLANATVPVDEHEMSVRATAMLAPENKNQVTSAMLDLVVVGGPRQRILRPAELEAPVLAEQLEQSALYGDSRLFDRTLGTTSGLDGSDLVLRQERGASIRLTEQGSVSLRLPLDEPRPLGRGFDAMSGMVIVEEVVQERLGTALDFAAGGAVDVLLDATPFINGNAVLPDGGLVLCEHSRRDISRSNGTGVAIPIAWMAEGSRMNAPNNVIVGPDGAIWFRDLTFGLENPKQGVPTRSESERSAICRIGQDGVVRRMTDMAQPNGLAFSPDGRTFYASQTPEHGEGEVAIYAFDWDETALSNQRQFATVDDGIPAGFTVDRRGWLWSSSGKGIELFDVDGTHLATAPTPGTCSNCTFDSDEARQFVTSGACLWMLPLA